MKKIKNNLLSPVWMYMLHLEQQSLSKEIWCQSSKEYVFLGYFKRSKAYKVYNSETNTVEELIHIKNGNQSNTSH